MPSTTFSHAGGVKRDRQQNYPAASAATLASAREFAASASKLEAFLATVPEASKSVQIRRLLHAAASDPRPSNVTAASLISNLDRLGIETAGYWESLQSFVQDRKIRKAHRGTLPPEAQRGARRSIAQTRAIVTSDALTSEVVPQNTTAMVKPGDRSVRKLVTAQVYDCVVLTYWDPVTKTGGMAHIPSGSNADLGPLREELKKN